MTREQQQKLIKECFEQRMEIMRKKSEDYSNGQDVLSNFKGSGANIGLTAEMQILSLIATKVARLGVLLNSNKVPENESIDDSIKDLANYTDLLYCAVNEGKAKSQSILDKLTDESKIININAPKRYISETFEAIDVPSKYPTEYHKAYAESQGKC